MDQSAKVPRTRQTRPIHSETAKMIKRRSASGTVLDRVNWIKIEQTVAREQSNREKFTPSISVFRWWARRPHSLMGAIIDAAQETIGHDGLSISDPFSGGGTVAMEGARRRIPTYAQDLYPWPIMGLTTSLTAVDPKEFDVATEALRLHLQPLMSHYTRADGRVLSHIIRVRIGNCPSCERHVYMFPENMVSKASRDPREKQGFFGCQRCGHVEKRSLDQASKPCSACGEEHAEQRRNHINKRCPHCQHEAPAIAFYGDRPAWKPALVQEIIKDAKERLSVLLRLPEEGDPLEDLLGPLPQEMALPLDSGHETRRLTSVGFHTWGDLYTVRQAQVILTGLQYVKTMKASESCRQRLAFALIGLGEMPAFLCRWDRFHQKVFEGIANHHFAHTNFVVESNLLSPIGRGTLPRRIKAARKALVWCNESIGEGMGTEKASPRARVKIQAPLSGTTVAIGSSIKQALPDASINLALTDPPYFDDVQYGELARLFHFWLSKYTKLPAYDEHQEAVPNTVRQKGVDHYEDAIMSCLNETRRTLKPGGRLILTFHNRKMAAWKALGNALRNSGFHISALAVTRAENDADHSKRNGKGMIHDLVIECIPASRTPTPTKVCHAGKSQEARELVSIGLALAQAVQSEDPTCMDSLFATRLKARRLKRERIT